MTALFSRELLLETGEDGQAVLDPRQLVKAVRELLEQAAGDGPIAGGGISAFMHSILALDRQGRPLTKLMTFLDRRGTEQAERLADLPDLSARYRRTGCRITSPIYPVAKLLWLREKHPAVFAAAGKFVTGKEYLCRELFGQDYIDVADASATGLYDTLAGRWDPEMLTLCALRPEQLGTVVPGETHVSWNGISLCLGLTDGVLAHRGCGARQGQDFSCTIGTSGALRLGLAAPLEDPGRKLWCYRTGAETFVAGGAITGGGVGLRWLRDCFSHEIQARTGEKDLYVGMDRLAEQAPPGCQGLTVLATPGPERSPDWNPKATAALWGLGLHHDLPHLVRGVMESVLYRLYMIRQCIPGWETGRMIASGGYTGSALWLQMQADLFRQEIAVPELPEITAWGAASLWEPELPPPAIERIYEPDPSLQEQYQQGYQRYLQLYRRLYGG